ncbi:hypothetical protein JB92DRAFT_3116576 [Gautieria morchelliformis]|nr:hypothetical protein JB92DRAFT_3116576 [Gautieria morchelliformis]
MARRRERHLCTCQLYCRGGRMVSHATYHRHQDARRMDLLSFDGGQPIEAEQEADTDRNMEVIEPDTQDVVNGFIVDGPSASLHLHSMDEDIADWGRSDHEPSGDATDEQDLSEEELESNEQSTPVAQVSHLKESLDFIRAVANASLDMGIFRTRSWLVFATRPNVSSKSMIRTNSTPLNNFLPPNEHPSRPIIKSRIATWTGVEAILVDMCPNSCTAFNGPFTDLEKCPYCTASRYDELELEKSRGKIKKAMKTFYTIPLSPQLQALMRNPKTARLMNHRKERTREILEELARNGTGTHTYDDLYHGSVYLNAILRGDLKDDDIVVMPSIDSAQLYQDKESDCWIYIWIVLNFGANVQYKVKHVFPGGIIAGKPISMESFLLPGLQHVSALQQEGLVIWDSIEDRSYISSIFYYLSTADGPGSVHVTGLVGHKGALACRIFCGLPGCRKPNISRYYPALLKPDNYDVPGSNHPNVDVSSIAGGDQEELTGILKPSIISGLPESRRLPIASTFCGDLMHLCTLNMGDIFVPLWCGTYEYAPTDDRPTWDWAVLKGPVWLAHGKAVVDALPYIPGSYDRPPRNLAEKVNTNYKAKEWQGYYYGLAPALLYRILPDRYWQNFCKIVRAVRIVHQWAILSTDLLEAQKLLDEFVVEFEQIYARRQANRIHFVHPSLHALIHLGLEVPHVGPANLYSAWTMERTIGNVGKEIKQHSNPFVNLSEQALQRSQVNALKSMIPELDLHTVNLPRGCQDIRDGYLLLRARE